MRAESGGSVKALVLGGSGKIGSAVAWDLARFGDFEAVGIAGRGLQSLERTKAWIGSDKVSCHVIDIADPRKTKRLMREFDVAVVALPDRRASYKALEAAIAAGLDSVDVAEEYHRRPDLYEREGLEIPEGMGLQEYGEELHQSALHGEITLLDGMGFAPGLSNVTLGEGIRKVEADRAVARVGGIPCKEAAAPAPARLYDHPVLWPRAQGVHGQGQRDGRGGDSGGGCHVREGEICLPAVRPGRGAGVRDHSRNAQLPAHHVRSEELCREDHQMAGALAGHRRPEGVRPSRPAACGISWPEDQASRVLPFVGGAQASASAGG